MRDSRAGSPAPCLLHLVGPPISMPFCRPLMRSRMRIPMSLESAYSMAQNLDPNSEGRGVLQFKTGLMSVIKQKLSKRDGAPIDRNRDSERLWEFYQLYKQRHKVDDIQQEEQSWRESGVISTNFSELVEMRKLFSTLRALVEVMEVLSKDAHPSLGRLITEELRRIKKSDATLSSDFTPYNIVPLDAPSLTNAIGVFPELRGAISALRYTQNFPRFPADYEFSGRRDADMFDLFEYIFGFQRDSVRNQRENVILIIANARSRLQIPFESYPMVKELDAILDHGEAEHVSCKSGSGTVSFLEQIICPIYTTIKADSYFEEAIKMRNLLEEFHSDHGIRPPTILGVREHVFTGSVSSQPYLCPIRRQASAHWAKGFWQILSSFNSTLRQGNITHHEYIQVGKGRDVRLNQIAVFEGKVAGGNGEQVLSGDVYRIGQLFDFFRMLSFYFTTVGYYVCTMMTVLTVYVFLYERVYLALSGLDEGIAKEARLLRSTALDAALNAQFLVQIGVFTAVPMIMGFILELGLLKAIFSFIIMQLQLCSVFFTFSLGTRTHYFGRTILHGGAKYRATGRGFVVRHIKFAENYRLYSRSHFVKALEVALLLIVYISYGYTKGGAVSFVLLTLSSWFLVISWLFGPCIFNPSGFEWKKTIEDFDDWTSWLLYKGGVGIKGENSWESWWDEEQMHIQTLRGRILETILSLRFFIFQYGFVYKLHLTGDNTSLAIFAYSPKKYVSFQLWMRFFQGVMSLGLIGAVIAIIIFTKLTFPDLLASILAFIATGWGIFCLAIAWKKVVRSLGLWNSVREFARIYDAGMGMIIFAPVAILSWFPFVSTFQSRLLFNQAFSRGLEISKILAGNKANVQV